MKCPGLGSLILTDLCKHNTDNALDADQCPGKPELLLFVCRTVITSGAAKQKESEIQAAKGGVPGAGLFLNDGSSDWSLSYEMTFHTHKAIVH